MTLSEAAYIASVIAALIAAGDLLLALYPIIKERRARSLLDERFSRGPYDQATIDQSTKHYIRQKGMLTDPAQDREANEHSDATDFDLFSRVDTFLDDTKASRHLLVLAGSGMGKTSFILNYYVHNLQRRVKNRHKISLVHLGTQDADELIDQVVDKESTNIFLDALDEDVKAIGDYSSRLDELMRACSNFRRVVITCRTQFFPKDELIPKETGIRKLGPRSAGNKSVYEFETIYIAPFDDNDIERYLKRRYPIWKINQRKRARRLVNMTPSLSVRPMLLAHVPDLLQQNAIPKFVYELYEEMINAWLEREEGWVSKDSLRAFSEELAVDLYINRESRGAERISRGELTRLSEDWGLDLEAWQISSRSLLNRDATGNYKFAHRSILEYLFVSQLLRGNPVCVRENLTDQMRKFVIEIIRYAGLVLASDFEAITSAKSSSSVFLAAVWCISNHMRFYAGPNKRLRAEQIAHLDYQLLDGIYELCLAKPTEQANWEWGKLLERWIAGFESISERTNALSILKVDPENPARLYLWWSRKIPPGVSVPVDQGLAGQAYLTRRKYYVPDVRQVTDYYTAFSQDTRSVICVPISSCKDRHHLLGVVSLDSTRKDAFSPIDLDLLEIFADRSAGVLEAFELQQQLPDTPVG